MLERVADINANALQPRVTVWPMLGDDTVLYDSR